MRQRVLPLPTRTTSPTWCSSRWWSRSGIEEDLLGLGRAGGGDGGGARGRHGGLWVELSHDDVGAGVAVGVLLGGGHRCDLGVIAPDAGFAEGVESRTQQLVGVGLLVDVTRSGGLELPGVPAGAVVVAGPRHVERDLDVDGSGEGVAVWVFGDRVEGCGADVLAPGLGLLVVLGDDGAAVDDEPAVAALRGWDADDVDGQGHRVTPRTLAACSTWSHSVRSPSCRSGCAKARARRTDRGSWSGRVRCSAIVPSPKDPRIDHASSDVIADGAAPDPAGSAFQPVYCWPCWATP